MATHNYKSLDCITAADISALGMPIEVSDLIHEKLAGIIRDSGAGTPQTWQMICKQVLSPELPFSFHQMMYYGCYKEFGPDPVAWVPDSGSANLTNIGRLLEKRGKEFLGSKYKDPISSFLDFQEFSVSNPEVYWKTILEEMNISFSVPPECILREDPTHPGGHWLPGAHTNPAKNCLCLNGKRNLDDVALTWQDEGADEVPVKKMTFRELRSAVWGEHKSYMIHVMMCLAGFIS